MYTEFYGLITYPFSLTPEPQFLYLSKKHEHCLHYLSYSLAREHGLIVLTGKIGTGKTLILNVLVKSLDEKIHRAYLVNPKLEFIDILQYISQAFGLENTGKSKIELLINLEKFLLMCEKMNEKAVIIIDEAQDLSIDALEELRLLTNFESHEKKLLQIILVGQPQLGYMLQLPELVQLAQRIGFNCQLFPMNYYETKGYIEKRLEVAGAVDPIFTSRAIKKIFVSSEGIPRVINLICDTALLFGAGAEKHQIGRTIIKQVMKELNLYIPEKSISPSSNQKRNGFHVGFSVPSKAPEDIEQEETWQSRRTSRRRGRLALVAGLTLVSLLGAEFVLPGSVTSGKLWKYIVSTVSKSQSFLPPGSDTPELPNSVQWAQTTVSYQFLTRKPQTVSLPQLQRTPETLPVKVTLEASNSLLMWLDFDAETLELSGMAPPREKGKTYQLTFRARTADGLESLLYSFLTIR